MKIWGLSVPFFHFLIFIYMEIYKQIPEFDNYEISNYGNIRNIKRNRALKSKNRKDGYLGCKLSKLGKLYYFKTHRLVALTYIENPHNLSSVDHIDRNRKNNYVNNLRWIDNKNNMVNKLINKNLIYFDDFMKKYIVQSNDDFTTYPYDTLEDAITHFNKLIRK